MGQLADAVREAAARSPGSVVADRRAALPLPDAVRRADELASQVRRAAGREEPVAAVVLPSSLDAIVHLLAGVLGDHTVCFLEPAGPAQKVSDVIAALDPDVVFDADGMRARARTSDRTAAPGYVAMSSGSTGGAVKGVLSTWDCLADFLPHGAEAMQLDPTASWAEPSHPAYDLAMTNWLLALSSGASLHVTSALADRLRPLTLAARVRATHVRLAPRYADLAAGEAARGVAAVVRVWGSGGDRLVPAQAERLLGLGIPALVNTYGTSETAGFASAATFTAPDQVSALHGSVTVGRGQLGPWRLEVAPEAMGGQSTDVLVVRSPHIAGGYLFGGEGLDYPRWEPGRVVTGDLGTQVDGDVFCFGRSGRLVKRSASFVNLDDVDLVLRDHRGLATYTVATRGGALVTLVEAAPLALDGVREELATMVAPDVVPDALVGVPRLPRLGNGKADQAGALRIAEQAVG